MDDDALASTAERYAEPDEVEGLIASALARLEWRRRRGFKECSTCHEAKDVSAFGVHTRERDGLRRECRECRRVNGQSGET